MPFKFEKLLVWQKAVDLSYHIHVLTLEFPREEIYILTSQIKRAADSVALNIAEGSTGQSNAEFARFLTISIRSNVEVVSCLHIGRKRGIVSESAFKKLTKQCEELLVMLNALKKTLVDGKK